VSAEELCKKVFALDERVFLVAVFKEERLLAGGPRKGRSGLITTEEKRSVIRLQLHLIKTMLKDWAHYFGDLERVHILFKKAGLYIWSWNDKWVHVAVEPSLQFPTLRDKVQRLLRQEV
jgi:hypothetical protein